MKTTVFGKSGVTVSRLGFGAMRLPGKEGGGFDEDRSIEMVRRAYELGVNYYDTAPYYCDKQSEIILGEAVKPFRDKIFLSTKNPIENNSGADYQKRLEHSLKQLGTDYIDFYHFWGISLETWINSIDVPDGPLSTAIKLKEQGIIRHISFSFHDKAENMIEIIKRGDGVLESVLCQYNLLDRSNEEGMKFAKSKGLGVVVMGPVGGGRLGQPSQAIRDMLNVSSSAEVAMRFVFNNEDVDIALSGMSDITHVEENAKLAANAGKLTPEQEKRAEEMVAENRRLMDLYCTGCRYCMPCPAGIDIPECFTLMNYHRVYGLTEYAQNEYKTIGKLAWKQYKDAGACIDCGACEDKCPQHLEIRKQLKETHALLSA